MTLERTDDWYREQYAARTGAGSPCYDLLCRLLLVPEHLWEEATSGPVVAFLLRGWTERASGGGPDTPALWQNDSTGQWVAVHSSLSDWERLSPAERRDLAREFGEPFADADRLVGSLVDVFAHVAVPLMPDVGLSFTDWQHGLLIRELLRLSDPEVEALQMLVALGGFGPLSADLAQLETVLWEMSL